jgi:hypothetical protein
MKLLVAFKIIGAASSTIPILTVRTSLHRDTRLDMRAASIIMVIHEKKVTALNPDRISRKAEDRSRRRRLRDSLFRYMVVASGA